MCIYGEDAMRFLSDVADGCQGGCCFCLRPAAADLSDINGLFV